MELQQQVLLPEGKDKKGATPSNTGISKMALVLQVAMATRTPTIRVLVLVLASLILTGG